MEVRTKQRCVIEFPHSEGLRWMRAQWGGGWCFQQWHSDVRGHAKLLAHDTKSALIRSSAQIGGLRPGHLYAAECLVHCVGNDVGNVGISQTLCQVVPTVVHMGTWRPPNASLSEPAGLCFRTHRMARIWHLLTSICSGRWKTHYISKIFVDAVIAAVRKWVASAGTDFYELDISSAWETIRENIKTSSLRGPRLLQIEEA
jgi:hypothetical protein